MVNNKYLETRKRICRFKGDNSLSDKDIIEYLIEEIEGYRNKIKHLEDYINKHEEETKTEELVLQVKFLQKEIEELKGIEYEGTTLDTAERVEDEDLLGTITTATYENGKVISETTEYKYKDKDIKERTKERKLKAIYRANIFEYDNGDIETAYICDNEKNKECTKESCTQYNDCKYTFNKKYAKNFINRN